MAKSMIKTISNTFFLILTTSFFVTSFAANKDIITGDIRPSAAKATVIDKAPEDAEFKSLDTDENGKISLQESIKDSTLALEFNDTDVNHDGVITVDEYAMYQSQKESNIN